MAPKSPRFPFLARFRRPFWKWVLWGGLGLTVAGSLTLAILWSIYAREADSFLQHFALRVPKTVTKVLDRNGDVIGVFAEEHRVVIPFGDIPRAYVGGLIATEDADFMNHRGVSSRGFMRAGWNFVKSFGRRREGASTLTMQLVRTVTARRERRILAGGLKRKFLEVIIARKLEKAYTKPQILEMYANEVYFGGGRYGLQTAAEFYFGKSAPQLNVEECAMLAGMVQQPDRFARMLFSSNPKDREVVRVRRNHVLARMMDEGYLKEADGKAIAERPIRLARESAQDEQIAPYAVEEIRKHLYERYGKDAVLNGGLEVQTTLDSVWQEAANEAVRKGLKAVDRRRGFRKDGVTFVSDPEGAKLPGWNRIFNPGDSVKGIVLGWKGGSAEVRIGKQTVAVPAAAFAWAGKDVQKILGRGATPLFEIKAIDDEGQPTKLELDQEPDVEAALMAVDHATGEIRAMVGGYDYNRSRFNRATQANRQVGSTMKAFVYGAAFALGKTPASLVDDVPTRFVNSGSKDYEPKNYERNFWGPIPIWEALRDSRNVPAVRTLDEVGVPTVLDVTSKAGIKRDRLPPFPSMALGAADLTLQEMVRGYATFANYGKQAPEPFLIAKVVDRRGQVLEQHAPGRPGEPAVDEMSAFQLIQCLQGVATQGTGARTNELEWPVAGKTGTTDDHTDAWFLGFSTRITCGVWVGLDAKKMIYKGADGGKVAVPIWTGFMKTALASTPKEDFKAPEGMTWGDIDRTTGLIATSATTDKVLRLAFKPGTLPNESTDGDALARIKAARDKAGTQPQDVRIWGQNLIAPPATPASPSPVDWTKDDPNADGVQDLKKN